MSYRKAIARNPIALGRRSLLIGAIAALVAGVLAVIRSSLEWPPESVDDYAPSGILLLVAVIPEILVLFGFLKVASEVDPHRPRNPLRMSTLGVFWAFWGLGALTAVVYLAPQPEPRTYFLVLVAIGVGIALLLGYAFQFIGAGVVLLVFLASRFVLGSMFFNRFLSWGEALALGCWLLLLGAIFGFPAWLGMTLMRVRKDVGATGPLLAGVIFANMLVAVIPLGMAVYGLYADEKIPRMDAVKLERALGEHYQKWWVVCIAGEISLAIAAALFLLSARRRLARRRR
jgi:hypothetical protein